MLFTDESILAYAATGLHCDAGVQPASRVSGKSGSLRLMRCFQHLRRMSKNFSAIEFKIYCLPMFFF
jgi:hypothetical protein